MIHRTLLSEVSTQIITLPIGRKKKKKKQQKKLNESICFC